MFAFEDWRISCSLNFLYGDQGINISIVINDLKNVFSPNCKFLDFLSQIPDPHRLKLMGPESESALVAAHCMHHCTLCKRMSVENGILGIQRNRLRARKMLITVQDHQDDDLSSKLKKAGK